MHTFLLHYSVSQADTNLKTIEHKSILKLKNSTGDTVHGLGIAESFTQEVYGLLETPTTVVHYTWSFILDQFGQLQTKGSGVTQRRLVVVLSSKHTA